jgi:alpha-tubulin suppressor-like RCC1 family protein
MPLAAGVLVFAMLAGGGQASALAAATEPRQVSMTAHAADGIGDSWRQVSAGDSFTCAVREGNTLWCWGDNDDGELGIDSTTAQDLPMRVGLRAGWGEVAAGQNFACAVRSGHTLWCWGSNRNGQLGAGTFRNHLGPVQVGGGTVWAEVSAGQHHACAIRVNGTLWCWGSDHFGQLGIGDGNGPQRSPVQVGGDSTWLQVSAGGGQTCAIRSDGTLWCWGANFTGQTGLGPDTAPRFSPVRVGSLDDWARVSAGEFHTCATRTDGTLWCWGYNHLGELGAGSTTLESVPVEVGTAANWGGIAAGAEHTCALNGQAGGGDTAGAPAGGGDPALLCWGNNSSGQLGLGTLGGIAGTPAQVGARRYWFQVSAGADHTCAIHGDRSLWCWGSNEDGQLGTGGSVSADSPVEVG